MTDDYKIQISPAINGELFNIRASSVQDMEEVTRDLAEKAPSIVANLNILRQVVVAESILTARAPSTSSGVQPLPSSAPEDFTCKHGPMKDLSEKNYRYTHYCAAKQGDPDQCPPRGKK